MPQDAPADTAGPSSPPPRMPEGWLPQWEGVQRKWYYVQRATGKSQWEIPTEPVVLTPSTTPTSIGTGPSQAPPSRPSTNSPQVTGLRGTMVERIEAVANSAKHSSSLNAQLNGQPGNTGHDGYSIPTDWYPEQNSHPNSHGYGQIGAPGVNAYGSGQNHENHETPGNMVVGSSSYYPHHSHPNQMIAQQHFSGNPWAQSSNTSTGQASGFNPQHYQHHPGLYQNPPLEVHDSQNPGSKVNQHPPQPEWRVEPQRPQPITQRQSVSQSLASGNSSQPYFPSNPASQVSDWSRRDTQSASSQSFHHSLSGSDYSASDAGQQKHPGSLTHFPTPVNNAQSTASYQMARSNSHQAAFSHHGPGNVGGLPSHEYAQHPHPSNQYSNSMTRSQSGTNFDSMGYAPGPELQNNAQFYQNPLVQAGMQQYQSHPQSSQPVSNMLPHGVYQNAHPTSQQQQWPNADPRLSRVSGSDPQFISGPWGSTPPT